MVADKEKKLPDLNLDTPQAFFAPTVMLKVESVLE